MTVSHRHNLTKSHYPVSPGVTVLDIGLAPVLQVPRTALSLPLLIPSSLGSDRILAREKPLR